MIRIATARSIARTSLRAERATLSLQTSTGLPPGRGLDQLPHFVQGFPRLIAPLLRDVGVKEIFPESAASPQVDDHGLPSTAGIDHKLDAWDFLQ